MNGSVHFSTLDGWHLEYVQEGVNSFSIGTEGPPRDSMDEEDYASMMQKLLEEILPRYSDSEAWGKTVLSAIQTVVPQFDSQRMAKEYFEHLYAPEE